MQFESNSEFAVKKLGLGSRLEFIRLTKKTAFKQLLNGIQRSKLQ